MTNHEGKKIFSVIEKCQLEIASQDEWELLYKYCYPNIYSYLKIISLKMGFLPIAEIENFAQETFLKLMEKFPERKFESLKHFDKYLDKVVNNFLIDCLRKRRKSISTTSIEEIEHFLLNSKEFSHELKYDIRENVEKLKNVLGMLPDNCIKIFEALLKEDITLAEFAKRNKISLGSIYTQYTRCLEKLKEIFKDV